MKTEDKDKIHWGDLVSGIFWGFITGLFVSLWLFSRDQVPEVNRVRCNPDGFITVLVEDSRDNRKWYTLKARCDHED